MRRQLSLLVLAALTVVGLQLSAAEGGGPTTAGLNHRYSIYLTSEQGTAVDSTGASYVSFRLKPGIGPTYDYYVRDGRHVTGRVESYREASGERQYVLEHFFDGRYHAMMRILDMPEGDNMKVGLVFYATAKEDPDTTLLQLLLIDDDLSPAISNMNINH